VNPVQKALDEIKRRIPNAVLQAAFGGTQQNGWNRRPISLDERIMATVIRPRVMVDANIAGGTEDYIPFEGLIGEREDDFTLVYRIPKSRTQGRSIISALNITFTSPNAMSATGTNNSQGGSSLLRMGEALVDAHGTIPVISSARCQIIAENVVMIKCSLLIPGYCFLRCVLGNDENLSHLQLKSIPAFCELVEYAVKSHIYNTLDVELDMGKLVMGQELGKIREKVDSYAEAETLYQTFLREKWKKIAFMNDSETYRRHIQRIVGGHR
jgi:hypothetical protein